MQFISWIGNKCISYVRECLSPKNFQAKYNKESKKSTIVSKNRECDKKFINNYMILDKISETSSCTVRIVRNKADKKLYVYIFFPNT